MAIERRAKIETIRDEVKELHPLLLKLLPKFPDVKRVEYTHGGETEMGADFVLHKINPALGTSEYTGVIAKVGKIVQDFTYIERQIDECAIPRTIFGGKEKVRLDEVWVVVTKHITRGAQEKIHEKYATRKIAFIDGLLLTGLVDKYLPTYWTGVSLETGEYLAKVRSRNQKEDQAVSLIPSLTYNMYIDQDIYRFPPVQYKLKATKYLPPQKVELDELLNQSKLVLVEGGMGAGKSKLLRHIVDRLTKPEEFEARRLVPVPISFKTLQEKYQGDVAKLITETVPEEMRKSEFSHLVLIDGVDETNLPVEEHVETIGALSRSVKASQNTSAIVTSRYLKGLEGNCDLDDKVVRYELAGLTTSKILEFIKTVCLKLNITKRFIEDLKKSQLFRELPHSPIAAILLAKLLNENPKELPSNMTELYSQYTEVVLGRWEIDKGLQTYREYQALEHVLIQIANQILYGEINLLSFDQVSKMVESYLGSRNIDIQPKKLIDIIFNRCEIIVADHEKELIGFKHRSFTEFFFAKELVRNGPGGVLEKAFNIYWMNSVFFYLGLLKDCPRELSTIVNLAPKSEAERWLKIINMSNYFLAAYASPFQIAIKGLTAVIEDAAELFKAIVEQKIRSPFACLPQMHLLYLMQLIIRESYSYAYFKNAIEEVALTIEDGSCPDDIKAYALFFLNVVYIDLEGTETFDFLLKKYTKNLPLDLSLAVGHESKKLADRSKLMRKQGKRIRELIKSYPGLQEKIKRMYERPIQAPKELPKG